MNLESLQKALDMLKWSSKTHKISLFDSNLKISCSKLAWPKLSIYLWGEMMLSRDIAIGTSNGKIMSLVCDEKDKKEKLGQAWSVSEEHEEQIMGVCQVPLKHKRVLLLVSTASKMYAFTGPESIQQIGANYRGAHGMSSTHSRWSKCLFLPPGKLNAGLKQSNSHLSLEENFLLALANMITPDCRIWGPWHFLGVQFEQTSMQEA